jgi:hypothetical protein
MPATNLPKRALRVVANPYLFVDHAGRLAGACPLDPDESAGERRFIGAEIDVELSRIVEKRPANDPRGDRSDVVWKFFTDVVEIANTPMHRQHVRSGDVLAADERTHYACGAPGKFQEPSIVLAALRSAAIEAWKAQHEGDAPAFAVVAEVAAKVVSVAKKGGDA